MSAESETCWVVAYDAFRDSPATKTCGAFQDNDHAQIGEMPYIQHPSFRRHNCAHYCIEQRVQPIGKPGETSRPARPFFSSGYPFETSRRFSVTRSLTRARLMSKSHPRFKWPGS